MICIYCTPEYSSPDFHDQLCTEIGPDDDDQRSFTSSYSCIFVMLPDLTAAYESPKSRDDGRWTQHGITMTLFRYVRMFAK